MLGIKGQHAAHKEWYSSFPLSVTGSQDPHSCPTWRNLCWSALLLPTDGWGEADARAMPIYSQSLGGRCEEWTGFVILASVSHQEQHTGGEGCRSSGREYSPYESFAGGTMGPLWMVPVFFLLLAWTLRAHCLRRQGALEGGRKAGFIGQLFRLGLPRGVG